jgi:DNA-binding HxlR family transcriptional regulator
VNVRRTRYHCPVEVTVEFIGGKWTVVLLAHLKEGERSYGELRRLMPDITEKMLTQRLRELERDGLIERAPADGRVRYRLSLEGAGLAPALQALYDWGERRAARDGITIEPVDPN